MAALKIPLAKSIRFIVFLITLVAAILMGINDEKTTTKSATYFYEAKFTYWGAFQFFVIVNSIACFFNFVIVFLPSGSQLWRLVVVVDWILTTLMVASIAMAWNTFKEMKTGVVEAGWSPLCIIFPAFCSRVVTSLVLGSIGLLICVAVFLYSIVVLADPFLEQLN